MQALINQRRLRTSCGGGAVCHNEERINPNVQRHARDHPHSGVYPTSPQRGYVAAILPWPGDDRFPFDEHNSTPAKLQMRVITGCNNLVPAPHRDTQNNRQRAASCQHLSTHTASRYSSMSTSGDQHTTPIPKTIVIAAILAANRQLDPQ